MIAASLIEGVIVLAAVMVVAAKGAPLTAVQEAAWRSGIASALFIPEPAATTRRGTRFTRASSLEGRAPWS